ncbi:RagB/SusD family nutrient uptake outer membrane protein [Dawidia soli]|uniref:RagB/SusD family nutrient uptake outer membrane protein n=1 Tax=Dawidia soli TaxID=2782352 RepID=A0AAP2D5R7_9BACT|nr:RagB/SusD family nutrient uptake outer membrane protein [Dawidia soli]MBT1685607.1 RagB/SusD family nutrient uptake outer membrane protein [Dawidia soli]
MKNILRYSILFVSLTVSLCACDYLDIVPDNVATLDHAFANQLEAEKYLYTCYSYLPGQNSGFGNIGLMGADEMWTYHPQNGSNNYQALEIAKGNQNINDPYMNCWDGNNGGQSMYRAIRDCNIFLENVSNPAKVADLGPTMRQRWIGEVQFLKAYFHFYLFRMYGPIVLLPKNHPVTSSTDEFRDKRAPVDEVVHYIAALLDTAASNLPDVILNRSTELGRVTRPAALMLKARLLVTAASPLFNGNPDYADFADHDGVHLFNSTPDRVKWDSAVAACEKALEACHASGARLYTFSTFSKLSDTTITQMSIRNAVGERWNPELIWGLSGRAVADLQKDCMARIDQQFPLNIWGAKDLINPTLNITHLFYTSNGVPMEEDKEFNYSGRYSLRSAGVDDRYNLIEGYETASIQFDRENRYYADLGFDGSVWYMQNSPSQSDRDTWTVRAKKGQPQSRIGANNYSSTGLWAKKLVNWKLVMTQNDATVEAYPWPEMRLADLYLLYAEALNEVGRGADALPWLDQVRARAGLKSVAESWTNHSIQPAKYTTQAGLRWIIQRERAIELMFEGSRFWDVRRWKTAAEELNQGIFGWNIEQEIASAYYHPRLLYSPHFIAPRDYLFPLKQNDLVVNPKLVQNPGW